VPSPFLKRAVSSVEPEQHERRATTRTHTLLRRVSSMMVTGSSRPTCSTVRHMGQRLLWSMLRAKQPWGIITQAAAVQCGSK
jgi:hypothetical protein